jgi:hypothetical protein
MAFDNDLGSGDKSPAIRGILYPEQYLRNTGDHNQPGLSAEQSGYDLLAGAFLQ